MCDERGEEGGDGGGEKEEEKAAADNVITRTPYLGYGEQEPHT